jgi:hypothetical protein
VVLKAAMNRAILSAVALSLALAAAPAQAKQAGAGPTGAGPTGATTLSFALDLDPAPGGWGFGGRVGFPIAPNGILHSPKVRDEFQLEVGGDYLHYEQHAGFAPYDFHYSWSGIVGVAGLQWNFWLVPQLALYPKVDLGFSTGWYSGWDSYYGYDQHHYGGLFAQLAAGLIWRLQPLDVRLELGTELVRLGVGFRL